MRWLLLVITLVCICCSSKNYIPDNVMKRKQMQAVMKDVITAEALAQESVKHDSSLNLDSQYVKYVSEVFALHKISKSDFSRSLAFYKTHPTLFKEVFDSMQAKSSHINVFDTSKVKAVY